jgi:hypothetical protein
MRTPRALLAAPVSGLLALLAAACSSAPAASTPPAAAPAPVAAPVAAKPETVTVRDPELEREVVRLRMQVLEKSAQLVDTERRLNEATTEVVRAMARLRTLATRAEAASAIAEAEVALQQLRGRAGQQAAPEVRETEAALRRASEAFDAENFGGAVYLATQAKRVATAGRGRLAESGEAAPRAGERAFAVPVPITTTSRANLRGAPSASGEVLATVNAGTALTAYAYLNEWIRVTTTDGRAAWLHQSLARGVAPQ